MKMMALIIEKVMTSRSNRFNTPVTSQGRELFDRLPSQARCLELNLVISIINDGFQPVEDGFDFFHFNRFKKRRSYRLESSVDRPAI